MGPYRVVYGWVGDILQLELCDYYEEADERVTELVCQAMDSTDRQGHLFIASLFSQKKHIYTQWYHVK